MRKIIVLAALAVLACRAADATCTDPQWLPKVADSWYVTAAKLMEAADFNGDGVPEIAGISTYYAFVLPVSSDGSMTTTNYAYRDARYLNGLTVGDFTSDGKTDLVVIDRDTKQLIVIPGMGDGTFAEPAFMALPEFPHALASGDVNGDGIRDAFVAFNDLHVVIAYAGDGHGGFTEISRSAIDPAAARITAGDLDGDGSIDLVVTHEGSTVVDVLFGAGNGTFAPALKITSGNYGIGIRLADIDSDGDLDLLFANWNDQGMSVNLNYGGRTFGAPALYGVPPSGTSWGSPADLVVADFNGDGKLDAVLATFWGNLVTLPGRGDGTFGPPSVNVSRPSAYVATAVVFDFDADGRPDVITSRTQLLTARNRCGMSTVSIYGGSSTNSVPPVLTVGQSFPVSVAVSGVLYGSRKATGTVELRVGGQTIGSGTLTNGSATVIATPTVPGNDPVAAFYLGDDEYDPAGSAPVPLLVTTETTRTTVTLSRSRTEYGEPLEVVTTVESSTGDTPTGYIYLRLDGGESSYYADGNAPRLSTQRITAAGTHQFSARFAGDSKHPPSLSAAVPFTVVRSVPLVTRSLNVSTSGSGSGTVPFLLSNRWGSALRPTGTATLLEGQAVVASLSIPASTYNGSAVADFSSASLAPGTHYVRVAYAGDGNYEPVTGPVGVHIVYPDSNMHLDARGDSANITVVWTPSGADAEMRLPSTAWGNASVHTSGDTYTWPAAGQIYLFRPRMTVNGATVTGPADLGQLVNFTDDPLTPGTVVRASHITEIVAALNTIRTAFNLSPVTLQPEAGAVIRADDIAQLRNWITQTRNAAGVYAVTFTNPARAGDPIRAIDIQELREAVR